MPGALDEISAAIGELRGQVAEVIRLYTRSEARLEQFSRDLTHEIVETRNTWHDRTNQTQALLTKIDIELHQAKQERGKIEKQVEILETRVDNIEYSRRRTKAELRLTAGTIGTVVAGAVEGAIQLWKWLNGGS